MLRWWNRCRASKGRDAYLALKPVSISNISGMRYVLCLFSLQTVRNLRELTMTKCEIMALIIRKESPFGGDA